MNEHLTYKYHHDPFFTKVVDTLLDLLLKNLISEFDIYDIFDYTIQLYKEKYRVERYACQWNDEPSDPLADIQRGLDFMKNVVAPNLPSDEKELKEQLIKFLKNHKR